MFGIIIALILAFDSSISAGGGAGLWTVGESADLCAPMVSEAHAARQSLRVVLWRSRRILGRQLRGE
jgi:hypothetical protein